jgi:hypothetical protein
MFGFAESAPAFGVSGESLLDSELYLLGRELPLPLRPLNELARLLEPLSHLIPARMRLMQQGLTALYLTVDKQFGGPYQTSVPELYRTEKREDRPLKSAIQRILDML